MLYVNNALAISMLPSDVDFHVIDLDDAAAAHLLHGGEFAHVGNPTHANTWEALATHYGMSLLNHPRGGKVELAPGDSLLIFQVNGLPRETREFTNEEIASATFQARLLVVED